MLNVPIMSKPTSVVVALLLAISTTALAADRNVDAGMYRRAHVHRHSHAAASFPLTWRAAKIRRADACWRGCLADAGRLFQACLQVHRPTECVSANDAADRFCLRECRRYGGPIVNAE